MKKPTTNNQLGIDIAVIANKVDNIDRTVRDIQGKLEKDYVTQDEFTPVKNIVYGMVGTVLLAVIGALIALVINK